MELFMKTQAKYLGLYLKERKEIGDEYIGAELVRNIRHPDMGWLAEFQLETNSTKLRKGEWLSSKAMGNGIVCYTEGTKFALCTGKIWSPNKIMTLSRCRPSEGYLMDAIADIRSFEGAQKTLREVLLGKKEVYLPDKIPGCIFFDQRLDKSQQEAVNIARVSPFLFVHGPAGSGKTLTLIEKTPS